MRHFLAAYVLKLALLIFIVPSVDARVISQERDIIADKAKKEWSVSERWAWERIREGKVADMSLASEPEAGEDKRDGFACKPHKIKEVIPPHRVLSASFIETVLRNPKLVKALKKPEVHVKCAYINQKIILENENVEPELFLEESYLTHGVNFISTVFSRRVGFENTKVNGNLNLANAEIKSDLSLNNGEYERVYLDGAKVTHNFYASNLKVYSTFIADSTQVSGAVYLSNSHFCSTVSFVNAGVKLDFWGSDIHAISHFNLYKATIGKDLFLRGNTNPQASTSFGHLDLGRAKVGGDVDLSMIHVTDKVTASEIIISGNLLMDKAVFAQPKGFKGNGEREDSVNLVDAYIGEGGKGGNAYINGVKVSSLFNVGGASIAGNLFANRAVFEAGANFVGASVGDDFSALSMTSEGRFDLGLITILDNLNLNPERGSNQQSKFTTLNISSGKVGKSVNLRGAQISKDFDARKVEIGSDLILSGGVEIFGNHEDDVATVDLESAIVKGKVQLFGGTFNGRMDFAEAQLGALEFSQPESYRNQTDHSSVSWKSDVILDLNNTRVGILRSSLDSWMYDTKNDTETAEGNWVAAGLSNFHYEQVSRGLVGDDQSMIDASDTELSSWLEDSFNKFKYQLWLSANKSSQATKFEDWVINQTLTKNYLYYTPGIYQQLIDTLKSQGMKSKADSITHRQRERRYDFQPLDKGFCGQLCFLIEGYVLSGIGYGVYPFRLLYAYLAIVIAGVGFSFFSRTQSGAFSIKRDYCNSKSLSSLTFRLWYRIQYSIENSLPLVPMSQRFEGIKHEHIVASAFFYIQKITGVLFATYIVGAFSLLIV